MRSVSKVLSLVLVALIMSTALMGCSTDELTVFNAMMKAQSISSMESKTDMTFKFDIAGLPEKDAQQAQMIVQTLNNMKLSLNQKTVQDKNKGLAKAQIDGTVNVGGMSLDLGMWVDMDYSSEKPVLKEVFKLPAIAKLGLPPEVGSKEYLVLDAGQMLSETPGTAPDFKKLMEVSTQYQEKTVDFLTNYAKKFNPGFSIVKASGTKMVNGVSLPVYQIKLDDAALKALIKYIGNDFTNNKETFRLVKDLVVSFAQVMEAVEPQGTETSKEIEKSFAELETNLPQFTEEFNKFMDAFKDVKILGSEGITIDLAVNNQGYIVNESGIIDLAIDVQSIANAAGKLSGEEASTEVPPVVVKLGITYNTDISKINENIEVKLPELTKENSANFTDIFSGVPEPGLFPVDNEPEIKVYVNDKKVNFNTAPVVYKDRTLAPAREVFESLKGEVLWNPETQTVTSTVNGTVIVFTIGSSEATVDGVPYKLDVPAVMANDRAYVPLRFLAESLGGQVHWDDTTSTALIIY